MCLLAMCISLEKCLFKLFSMFLNVIFAVWFRNPLYIPVVETLLNL